MTSEAVNRAVAYIYLPGEGYVPAGVIARYRDHYTFRYGARYVRRKNAIPLDPVSLPIRFAGEFVSAQGMEMFNALRDASPDRWGRKVIGLLADRDTGLMSELEILTAMHSPYRIGALAFGRSATSGPCSLASWAPSNDPFVKSLEDLEEIAGIIAKVEAMDEDDLDEFRDSMRDSFLQAFTSIYSVGGARPKCLMQLDGGFWVVKFPKADDGWNEPLIEHCTMRLARACGISVAATGMRQVGGKDVLLVRRFDRDEDSRPRHMISALTLSDRREDGEWGSYQDLAEAARQYGDTTPGEELFRRMAFNACFANTDDHLRNQAWFVRPNSVELTPAYDITPQWRPNYNRQALGCGDYGHEASVRNLLSRTGPFGLSGDEARSILEEMLQAASGWAAFFSENGVSDHDVRQLAARIRTEDFLKELAGYA
jgi:serine/threonine-protein kinase HipA